MYKEYLTVTKFKTTFLLWIKYWTVWYMDHLSASSYTRVTNFQKCEVFIAPPCTFYWRQHTYLRDVTMKALAKSCTIRECQDSNLRWRKRQDLFRKLLLWSCTRCCRSTWDMSTFSADCHRCTGVRRTGGTLWTLHHWFLPVTIQLSSTSPQNARRFCQLWFYRYRHGRRRWRLRGSSVVVIFPRTAQLQCTDRLVTNLKICSQTQTIQLLFIHV